MTDSVELALRMGEGALIAWIHGTRTDSPDREELFSERLACDRCNVSLPELTPQMFSFNSPQGACPVCDGLGQRVFLRPRPCGARSNLEHQTGRPEALGEPGQRLLQSNA